MSESGTNGVVDIAVYAASLAWTVFQPDAYGPHQPFRGEGGRTALEPGESSLAEVAGLTLALSSESGFALCLCSPL